MPQIFRIGSYIVYFWSNEGIPLEPVHVHIAEGRASANAPKGLDHTLRSYPALQQQLKSASKNT